MISEALFRVDASHEIGSGHVMRCLALADEIANRGGRATFATRHISGNLIELIKDRGHLTIALGKGLSSTETSVQKNDRACSSINWKIDALDTINQIEGKVFDWLVVDHYSLDINWETTLRKHTRKILVIDDLANRKHDCDVILDQNLGRYSYQYDSLLRVPAKKLIGPKYALLRPDFAQNRNASLARRNHNSITNILLSMGGVDQGNISGKVLAVLNEIELSSEIKINVVVGAASPWNAELAKQAKGLRHETIIYKNVANMAELMAKSDLAIGAAGITALERCALGLPTILFLLADNQKENFSALEAIGAAKKATQTHLEDPDSFLKLLKTSAQDLQKMSGKSASICDGMGCLRTLHALESETGF